MNLAQRLIRLCEALSDDEEGRNRIFLREDGKTFIVDSTLADLERNTLIQNTINDLSEGGNWNQLQVLPTDNVYITFYQTTNGKLKVFKDNNKKFPDIFQFTSEADAREFFDIISVDFDQEEETEEEDISITDASEPEEVEIEASEDVEGL